MLTHDNFVHGGIGALLASPFGWEYMIVGYLAASAIDVDHLNFSESFRLLGIARSKKPASLSKPYGPTHSMTFGLILAVFAFVISPSLGVVVWSSITSHILRDAAMHSTPFLWPLNVTNISYKSYYGGIGVILVLMIKMSGFLF